MMHPYIAGVHYHHAHFHSLIDSTGVAIIFMKVSETDQVEAIINQTVEKPTFSCGITLFLF